MPLIEATGTRIERMGARGVKNSIAPERSWLNMLVSEPSSPFGKISTCTRPLVSVLILPRPAKPAGSSDDWRRIVGVLVRELGGLGSPSPRERGGASVTRQQPQILRGGSVHATCS